MHNGFTSPYCQNYLIKQSFSSDIKNFLIELRLKIPFERGIKMISPRCTSLPNCQLISRWTAPKFQKKKQWVNSEKIYGQTKRWIEGQTEGQTLPAHIANALPRQTKKSWIFLIILLPTNLATKFWRLFFVDDFYEFNIFK